MIAIRGVEVLHRLTFCWVFLARLNLPVLDGIGEFKSRFIKMIFLDEKHKQSIFFQSDVNMGENVILRVNMDFFWRFKTKHFLDFDDCSPIRFTFLFSYFSNTSESNDHS